MTGGGLHHAILNRRVIPAQAGIPVFPGAEFNAGIGTYPFPLDPHPQAAT